jgi:hypothetical protein
MMCFLFCFVLFCSLSRKRTKLHVLKKEIESEREKENEKLRFELENKAKQQMVDYILWGSTKSTN